MSCMLVKQLSTLMLRTLLLLCIANLSLNFMATPAYGETKKPTLDLVLGHNLKNNDPLLELFLKRWAHYFHQVTEKRGRIILRGPQDGKRGKNKAVSNESLHKILLNGKVDLAFVNLFETPQNAFFYSKLFSLPFVSQDSRVASLAFWEIATDYLQSEYRRLKLLSLHIDPYSIVHYGNRPLTSLADAPLNALILPGDLKGRIIATKNIHTANFIAFTQGTPVNVPFFAEEKARTFTLGKIDAFWLNWNDIKGDQLNFLNRHTVFTGFATPYYFAFNQKSFNLLPKEWQKILRTSLGGKNLVNFAIEVTEHIHTQELRALQKKGNIVFTLKDEQKHVWRNDANLYINDFFQHPEHINNDAMLVVFNLIKEKIIQIENRK